MAKILKLKRRNPLCQCGCGNRVRLFVHSYLTGHNRRGVKIIFSEETKRKMSLAHKGKKPSVEHRKKLSISMMGKNKGKKASLETRKKLSIAHMGIKQSKETCKKRSDALKGRIFTEEWKRKISEGQKGKVIPVEQRIKISKTLIAKGYRHSEEWKRQHSLKMKSLYKKGHFYKRICLGRVKKPNYLEKRFQDLIDYIYPGEWKYTGNFDFWLGGKNPDFMNVNGQKKLIEVCGRRWHGPEYEVERPKHFKKYGFDTLIVWAEEFKDLDKLISKVKGFCDG